MNDKRAQAYQRLVARLSPKSDMAQGIFRAYWVGGVICALGQTINDLFAYGLKWGAQSASTATSICLIFASSLLTGLGVYDKIGKYAGAGSIVPITGFANSVVSPAMEFRREGLVMGVGAKLFKAHHCHGAAAVADLRHRRLDRRRAGGAGHGRGAISRAEDCGHFAARAA